MAEIKEKNPSSSLKGADEPVGHILVVGGGVEYIRMFYEAGWLGATSIEDADVVCFTGGEDVDPKLYGERPLNTTHYNSARDEFEKGVYEKCNALGIPMVGICRGGQFLNVMNGGKMWQHVNRHARHDGHPILNEMTGEEIVGMTSTHHQMMIPNEKEGFVVATACEATSLQSYGDLIEKEKPEQKDVEVIWYDKTRCLCFQPHPEYHHGPCRDFFLDLLDDFIIPLI